MASREDELLVELAVKNHLISQSEGQECLAASVGDVGAVLLEKGYIKERHLKSLRKKLVKLVDQEAVSAGNQTTPPTPPAPPQGQQGFSATDATFVSGPTAESGSGMSASEATLATGPGGVGSSTGLVLFGQIALHRQFITQTDLDWALYWQPQLVARGQPMKIGEILVKGQRMSQAQVEEVLSQQRQWNSQISATGPSQATPGPPGAGAAPAPATGRGPSTPDDPGGLLGREWKGYRVEKILGKGGMGAVYRATQTSLGREVALKVMLRPPTQNPNASEERERFMREAKLVANLNHPNIVGVVDAQWDEDFSWFTMELVPGKDLKHHLRKQLLTIRGGAAVVARVARAMHFAHERGVIHRDIKPQNIMIDEESGEPKILDFGLAKNVDAEQMQQLTQMGAFLGTPAYMAPEQAGGDPNAIDRRADVYALGAILFEVLTNRPPFTGKKAIQVIRKVLKEDPPDPRELNPNADARLSAIALKTLSKDPDDRYQDAAQLADAIEGVIGRVSRSFNPLKDATSTNQPTSGDQTAADEPKKKGFFGRLFGG